MVRTKPIYIRIQIIVIFPIQSISCLSKPNRQLKPEQIGISKSFKLTKYVKQSKNDLKLYIQFV